MKNTSKCANLAPNRILDDLLGVFFIIKETNIKIESNGEKNDDRPEK